MRLIQRIQEWRRQRLAVSTCKDFLHALERKIRRVEKERLQAIALIQLSKAEVQGTRAKYDAAMSRLEEAVERAEAVAKKQSETIDGLQEQLKTAQELTIPTLVASNKLAMDRWEHESQILAMRSGAMAAANNQGET